jgi:hypothetical protein
MPTIAPLKVALSEIPLTRMSVTIVTMMIAVRFTYEPVDTKSPVAAS